MKPTRTDAVCKRILLVDDHPLMCEGVARWIEGTPDLGVCGRAETAAQAITLVEKLKPDLVITDLSLAGGSGLELVKDLRVIAPEIPVLVLSMHEESLYAGRALRAGARGYVMKRAGGDRLVNAIRQVLAGQVAVSPQVTAHLLGELSGKSRAGRQELPELTDREFEIFQLIGGAKSNQEIAEQLGISIKTVQTHRVNLAHKLNLKGGTELLRYALHYAEAEASGNLKT